MKFIALIIFLFILFLIPLVFADTTFFDNPDDVFIMGNSPTDEVIGGTTEETTGGESCLYKWDCTSWGECLSSEKQIRNCINIGTCPNTYNSPLTEQNCNYTSPESEEKTEKVNKENAGKNLSWLFWIVVGIVIGAAILSGKLPALKVKRKEEGTMLIDKCVIEILKEKIQGKNVKGKWVNLK